jgi:hypothetical protein
MESIWKRICQFFYRLFFQCNATVPVVIPAVKSTLSEEDNSTLSDSTIVVNFFELRSSVEPPVILEKIVLDTEENIIIDIEDVEVKLQKSILVRFAGMTPRFEAESMMIFYNDFVKYEPEPPAPVLEKTYRLFKKNKKNRIVEVSKN